MILNTGSRTDIPAFYSEWFFNRMNEGFVMARNPFYPNLVTRFRIDPDVSNVHRDVAVFVTDHNCDRAGVSIVVTGENNL